MTRPMTPARKTGVPSADTYVVCLECGKQFLYDINEMQIGKPVTDSTMVGLVQTSMPWSKRKKLRYLALASAGPIALVFAVGFKWLKKSGEPHKDHKSKGAGGDVKPLV